jgi:hypothetical protein
MSRCYQWVFCILWTLWSISASADFFPHDRDSNPEARRAVEAAQCSGLAFFKSQLAQRAGNRAEAEASFYTSVELQTLAALAFVNESGMTDEVARDEVRRLTELTANQIAQDLLQNFDSTWDIWHSQCEPYVIEARETISAEAMLEVADRLFWMILALLIVLTAVVGFFVWRRRRLKSR